MLVQPQPWTATAMEKEFSNPHPSSGGDLFGPLIFLFDFTSLFFAGVQFIFHLTCFALAVVC